jgi:hypothetical protein
MLAYEVPGLTDDGHAGQISAPPELWIIFEDLPDCDILLCRRHEDLLDQTLAPTGIERVDVLPLPRLWQGMFLQPIFRHPQTCVDFAFAPAIALWHDATTIFENHQTAGSHKFSQRWGHVGRGDGEVVHDDAGVRGEGVVKQWADTRERAIRTNEDRGGNRGVFVQESDFVR